MKKTFTLVLTWFVHALAVIGILVSFFPMATWYLNSNPIWGVDFYYTVTLTTLLKNNFFLPPGVWNYIWFTGTPLLTSFPILHYYLILPFTLFLDIFSSIKVWMIVSASLYFIGSYFLFYKISKNRFLATILAMSTIYSIGFYGSLTWGGSLSSFATQAFYPWVLFFIVEHQASGKRKYLLSASLLTGLSIWAHPQIAIAYIFPTCAILYLFRFNNSLKISRRLTYFAELLFISVVVGFPLIYKNLEAFKVFVVSDAQKVAASTARLPTGLQAEIDAFIHLQPTRIFTDNQPLIFVFLAFLVIIYILGLIVKPRLKAMKDILPFLLVALWFGFYTWLFSRGISIYHGGWYRLFWAVSIYIGMLVSALWAATREILHRFFVVTFNIVFIIVAVVFLFRPLSGWVHDITRPDIATKFINPKTFGKKYYYEDKSEILAPGTISLLVARSQTASGFPDVTDLKTQSNKLQELKQELIPNWLPGDETNYRLYEADQTVNIWWNTHFKMPLVRGYLDTPTREQRGYSFWVDASLNQDSKTHEHQLVSSFGYPVDIAVNNTLFLINWYGIKYFEAGHEGPTVFSPLPAFLTTKNFMIHDEILDFNKEKFSQGNQQLHYYQIRDDLVTPVLMATNAPTLGIVASDGGYETIVRAMADTNFGVGEVIPIKLGRDLDKIDIYDLPSMDALFLYDYQYKNKTQAFRLVEKLLENGKNVYIDTGVEGPESHDSNLPKIFPFGESERKPLGETWELEVNNHALTEGINFSVFSPPIFDNSPWKFSYPSDKSNMSGGATIILKNHHKALFTTQNVGSGEIFWSGINLPYHIVRYHNNEEVKFFRKILLGMLHGVKNNELTFQQVFTNAEHRVIKSVGAKGILFKEQAYPGWKASMRMGSNTKGSKIFKAGPAHPGFMYVRIPEDTISKEVAVKFDFYGSLESWFFVVISLMVIIVILERVFLSGIIFGKRVEEVGTRTREHLKGWWEKDT